VVSPAALELLRDAAVHRESAGLLDLRAAAGSSPVAADLLRWRAAARRGHAEGLLRSLHRLDAQDRHPANRS
jgi:hypothetical protein